MESTECDKMEHFHLEISSTIEQILFMRIKYLPESISRKLTDLLAKEVRFSYYFSIENF